MKSPAFVILFALLFSCAIAGAELIKSSTATSSIEAGALSAQFAFEKSEAAYRANNIGVALLEQYKAKEAVDSFTRALQIKPEHTPPADLASMIFIFKLAGRRLWISLN